MTQKPALYLWDLVHRDIVDDELRVERFGHDAVDEVQEPAELDGAVAFGHVGDGVDQSPATGEVENRGE